MSDRQHYTLSIAMTRNGKFLFVDKEHGPMQGTLIFPGGKVEEGEPVEVANVREFKEEIGVDTDPTEWVELVTINYPAYTLHVLFLIGRTIRDSLVPANTDTGEKIKFVGVEVDNPELVVYSHSSDLMNATHGPIDGLCAALIKEVVYKL